MSSERKVFCWYIPYSKKHWQWKNFSKINYSISPSFLPIFTIWVSITFPSYANGLQFAKVFSAKLHTVLIRQTFYHQSFYYMIVHSKLNLCEHIHSYNLYLCFSQLACKLIAWHWSSLNLLVLDSQLLETETVLTEGITCLHLPTLPHHLLYPSLPYTCHL